MFYTSEKAVQSQGKQRIKRFPAPVRGLIRNENIALTQPGGALFLENWFPTSTGMRSRRGIRKHATLTGASAVAAIMPYQGSGVSKLFAANDSGIFDITTVANPNSPLSAASGIGTSTSGLYSHIQFSTTGGEFLFCVNGTNLHKVFNGTIWTENSPAITGTTTDNWSHVWSHQNRIFGIKKNSKTAVYLSSASIGGATTDFPLGGVFKLGGTLLFGATWSLDSGEGLDDLCVFVSSNGEVAVYAGSDPVSWALQGVYKIGTPMGKNAHFKAGGDLMIATDDGLVSMTAALRNAREALRELAVSYPIEELWLDQTQSRAAVAWQCSAWPLKQMLVVSTPTYGGAAPQVLVANTRTGAWTVYTAWDCRGLAPFGSQFFFGNSGGLVFEAETGGADNGANYTCSAAGLFDDLKSPALQKVLKLIRGVFQSNYQTILPKFSASVDFQTSMPSPPLPSAEPSGAVLWGSVAWGGFVWGGTSTRYRYADWHGVDGVGFSISWQLQVTLGNISPPDIELAAIDLTYEEGEAVA